MSSRRRKAIVYILHFDQPLASDTANYRRGAQHYTGWTVDLDNRLKTHAAGNGGRLPAVFAARGIGFVVGRTWEFDSNEDARHHEWVVKHRLKNAKSQCVVCAYQARPELPERSTAYAKADVRVTARANGMLLRARDPTRTREDLHLAAFMATFHPDVELD